MQHIVYSYCNSLFCTFKQVIWKNFYDISSADQKGTMYQLKCLINRSTVLTSPKRSFDSCNDFFSDVTKAYVISAAMSVLHMDSIDDSPSASVVPLDVASLTKEERRGILYKICAEIVKKYVLFQFIKGEDHSVLDSETHTYFTAILSLGMFYMEFVDAIKEGDGLRVHRCWKYLLPIFKSSQRTNYSVEVLRYLYEYAYIASPMHCHQMLWSRFVNTVGKPGHNIPADLHMEHLNRALKEAVSNLRSNKSEKSIIRAGKALGTLVPIVTFFDELISVSKPGSSHAIPLRHQDVRKMVYEIHKNNLLSTNANQGTAKVKNLLHGMKYNILEQWIYEHVISY